MKSRELISRVKEDDVKFISLQFTDVTGSVKSVDITTGTFAQCPGRWGLV